MNLLSPIPTQKYSVGDVITYSAGKNALVSHRVIKVIDKDGTFFYQTKGDHNNSVDGNLIEESSISGKVEATIPYFGKLITFTKKPAGYVMMIVIPCLYLIGTEIFGIYNELKKKKESSLATI